MTVEGKSGARRERDGTRQVRDRRSGAPARGRSLGWPSRIRAAWLATLAAVLLAFSWQSFVTQTHQHFDPGAVSAAAPAMADGAGPRRESPSDLPANCSICRALAHAGALVPPAPIEFGAPAPAVFRLAPATPLGLTHAGRSHAWQSRAPPHQLQA